MWKEDHTANLPVFGSNAQALCEQIRTDGRRVVERHLFEAQAQNKANSSQFVAASREKVDGQ